VITVPGLAGAAQVTASTGTGTWIVGTTPGGAWSLAEDGDAAPGSGFALASSDDAATGTPSLLRTQPDATPAVTNTSATPVHRPSFISP
jgi:hypothetical protein